MNYAKPRPKSLTASLLQYIVPAGIAVLPAVAFSKAFWGALPFLILVMMWGSLGAELDTLQACLSVGGLNKV